MHVLLAAVLAQWMAPSGAPLPFDSDAAVERFLSTAEVIEQQALTGSRNHPIRLVLRQGGVEARAIFRTVDKKKASARVGDVTIRHFRDSYRFECAAYRLSRMLGMESVPPCVFRTIDGTEGSVQLWIEDAVTEFQHRHDQDGPSAADQWPAQYQTMYVFDALIHNFDRHPGNILIDAQDRMWLIDHTRSFRLYTDAPDLERITSADPALCDALERLDRDRLDELKPYIEMKHIDALTRRHQQLLKHIESLR